MRNSKGCVNWMESFKEGFEISKEAGLEVDQLTMKDLDRVLAHVIVVGTVKDSLITSKVVALCSVLGVGNLEYAQLVLRLVEEPSPYLWNTVIRGYEQSFDPREAILLHRRMLRNGIFPDKFTFPFVLKACIHICAVKEGQQIHCRILKSPHQLDLFVHGFLMLMYSKCGKIGDAHHIFDLMPQKNSVCWNTIIDGYIKHGNVKAALQLFDQMPQRDLVSWNAVIDGHCKVGQIEAARQLFDVMPERDVISWNSMIDGYAKYGDMRAARELFDEMPSKDVVSWAIMINGYAKCGKIEIAHHLFEKMPHKSLVSWNALIDGYAKCGNIEAAVKLFEQMPRRNLISWNILLDAHMKFGKMEIASQMFDTMPERDLISWNIMIDGYARTGSIGAAKELFGVMPFRDVVSWNALIAGYKQNAHPKEAIELFHHMMTVGERPDCATLAIVLSAIADLGLLAQGRWVHAFIDKKKFSLDGAVGAALLDMYGKCGSVDIAMEIFKSIAHKSTDHWNSMISGLAIHGHGNRALCMFEEMQQSMVWPDDITFIGVLSACSHAGLLCEGRLYFKLMTLEYKITPKIQHFGCMVDLLSRAGLLEEAMVLVTYMPMMPNGVVWRALLGASRNHGNVEIGELAAKHLIELEPHDTSSYVLLSNIYGATGRWKEAMETRKVMKERGLKKAPGCSSIEVNGVVYEFSMGDTSHPQSNEIILMLNEMTRGLVSAGYALDIEHLLFDTEE